MIEFLQQNEVKAVLLVAILAVLVTVGVFVVLKFRGSFTGDGPATGELLSNFREMRDRGALSDDEFRTIKGELADRTEEELNGNGETT